MTRKEVRDYIRSAFVSLSESFDFGSGRITEFNSSRSNNYPSAWLESLTVDTEEVPITNLPIDGWPILIHISRKDKVDSSPDDYESIIDECDETAQKVMEFFRKDKTSLITISGINRTPFIKKHADCLTGVLLSFTITVPDKTDVC